MRRVTPAWQRRQSLKQNLHALSKNAAQLFEITCPVTASHENIACAQSTLIEVLGGTAFGNESDNNHLIILSPAELRAGAKRPKSTRIDYVRNSFLQDSHRLVGRVESSIRFARLHITNHPYGPPGRLREWPAIIAAEVDGRYTDNVPNYARRNALRALDCDPEKPFRSVAIEGAHLPLIIPGAPNERLLKEHEPGVLQLLGNIGVGAFEVVNWPSSP
jgi:hypothetical protein